MAFKLKHLWDISNPSKTLCGLTHQVDTRKRERAFGRVCKTCTSKNNSITPRTNRNSYHFRTDYGSPCGMIKTTNHHRLTSVSSEVDCPVCRRLVLGFTESEEIHDRNNSGVHLRGMVELD